MWMMKRTHTHTIGWINEEREQAGVNEARSRVRDKSNARFIIKIYPAVCSLQERRHLLATDL
jgi:hypothetical protein